MLHTPRIRCNYCERRIPASSVVCPNCQRNPRAFYWKRQHVLLLLGVLALVLIGAALLFADDLLRLLPASIALNPAPTATRANTRPPVTVVLVATSLPRTSTPVPPPATAAPTATPAPTNTPTMTLTGTVTVTDVNPATQTPVPTETPSPIPTIAVVTPPSLLAPTDNEQIIGANKRIQLQFQPAQALAPQQWFRIQVDFLDRAGNPVSWCSFTRASSEEFPREFFDDSSPSVRSFLWRVNVVHSNEFTPSTCDAPYDILSAPSQVWTFFWY
jgi:hypothetical protein